MLFKVYFYDIPCENYMTQGNNLNTISLQIDNRDKAFEEIRMETRPWYWFQEKYSSRYVTLMNMDVKILYEAQYWDKYCISKKDILFKPTRHEVAKY